MESEGVPVHVTKVHGEVEICPTNSKLRHWTEVSGYPHNPVALFPGTMLSVPLRRTQYRLQKRSGFFGEEKNVLSLLGIEARLPGRPSCSLYPTGVRI